MPYLICSAESYNLNMPVIACSAVMSLHALLAQAGLRCCPVHPLLTLDTTGLPTHPCRQAAAVLLG
jgi:hypothetical protein